MTKWKKIYYASEIDVTEQEEKGRIVGDAIVWTDGATSPVQDEVGEGAYFECYQAAAAHHRHLTGGSDPFAKDPVEDLSDFIGAHCLMTTDKDKRGVFIGILGAYDTASKVARVRECRMVVEWSVATRGVLGLAAKGPQEGCRITDPVPLARIEGVEFICRMYPNAVEKVDAAKWPE